jgi:hypothetical protein
MKLKNLWRKNKLEIRRGQRVELKGEGGGKWKEFEAAENFNTGDTRWKLKDLDDGHTFEPLGERCKIRLIDEQGKKRLVKYKKDSEVWDVIKAQIEKSKIKRYSWDLIFGESLTRTILRHKMNGLTSTETYHVILEHPMVEKITKFFPDQKARIEEKIQISVSARYGKNDSALSLYNKEFRKNG